MLADASAALRIRADPIERAASGWLRFGITALPEHGPPRPAH
jgi:hypothetical protein